MLCRPLLETEPELRFNCKTSHCGLNYFHIIIFVMVIINNFERADLYSLGFKITSFGNGVLKGARTGSVMCSVLLFSRDSQDEIRDDEASCCYCELCFTTFRDWKESCGKVCGIYEQAFLHFPVR